MACAGQSRTVPYDAAVSGSEILEVYSGQFSFEEPWSVPPNARLLRFTRSHDGAPGRLATEVAVYYNPTALFIVFAGRDDQIVATMREYDAPLWKEDVLEAFLSPADPAVYFEIEVSPLGTMFDARIVSPFGDRATMRVDQHWTCIGAWNAVMREYDDGAFSFRTVLSLPFSSLDRNAPAVGEQWRANFYRIDRSPAGDEYTAWRPTYRNPPDFHVPVAFGTLMFRP
jgi:alpha-galactosidase